MNKNAAFLIIAIIAIIAVLGCIYFFWGNNKNGPYKSNLASVKETAENLTNNMEKNNLENNLKITDIAVGTGVEAKVGDVVSVNYAGALLDGKKFDSSYDRNQPFSFTLGVGEVIKGWDEGVAGMKVGGKRKLVIPPDLAYGGQDIGNGLIPANSTLIFEVELLGVQPGQ